MYPSGMWHGFWEQEGWGRQPMRAFELHFSGTAIRGQGEDVIGRFTIAGTVDRRNGSVSFIKQYLGRHQVEYVGQPDGEGCIGGKWTVRGVIETWTGPFLLKPSLPEVPDDAPIQEIGS